MNINKILEELAKLEGNKFHKNKGEKDITTPHGIYRTANKKERIFRIVDKFAKILGIDKRSTNWTKKDLELINNEYKINSKFRSEILAETKRYYLKIIKKSGATLLPEPAQLTYFLIYINSPKNAVIAVQNTINYFRKLMNNSKLIQVDGIIGPNTRRNLNQVKSYCTLRSQEQLFIMTFKYYMSKLYCKIGINSYKFYVKQNKLSKYFKNCKIRYVEGWHNRLEDV